MGQQSPGCCANDSAVPQPSGRTKDCKSFRVDVEDESDEEDNDADTVAGMCL